MTSTDLKAVVSKYGNRICAISFDNGERVLFGYRGTVNATDIKWETFGEREIFSVKQKGTSTRPEYTFQSFHDPEGIRHIYIIDEEFKDYRIDPVIFR